MPGRRPINAIAEKLESLFWGPRIEELPPVLHWIGRVLRFIFAVLRDSIAGDLPMRAMGLVYVTILSIVPVLAISFSVLKGFGFHYQIEPLLYQAFEPLGDKGVEITDQLIGFVENTQGSALAGVGLILLFVTTLSMAQKVEDSFNHIWRVSRARNVAQRITQYMSVILLGPVVMVTALALIGSLKSTSLVQTVTQMQPIGALLIKLGTLAPYFVVSLGFAFVYWFLPNTRVRGSSALVGGLIGGILWAGTSAFFATFVADSLRTMTIYAGFAVVIVALIWIYLCWLILLVGAQVSFYYQNPEYMRIGYRHIYLGSRQREQIALSIMQIVAERFRAGNPAPTINDVAERLDLPGLLIEPVVERLESAGHLIPSANYTLLPARDPELIMLKEVISAVREPQSIDLYPAGHWPGSVIEVTGELSGAVDSTLGGRSIYALLPETAVDAQQQRAE